MGRFAPNSGHARSLSADHAAFRLSPAAALRADVLRGGDRTVARGQPACRHRPLPCDRPSRRTARRCCASNGLWVPCAALPAPELHTLFVCAGGGPQDWRQPALPLRLRQLARLGVRLGGISGGAFCWRRRACSPVATSPSTGSMPRPWPKPSRISRRARPATSIDGDRITCGGGVAPLDMMHALIAERMGSGFRAAGQRLVSAHRDLRAGRSATGERRRTLRYAPPGPPRRARDDGGNHRDAALPCRRRADGRRQRTAARPAVRVKVWHDLACGLSEAAPGTDRSPPAAKPALPRPDRLCHRLLKRQPFSRAFRNTYGQSPAAWRARQTATQLVDR